MRKQMRIIPAIALLVLASACVAGTTEPLADDGLSGNGTEQVGQAQDDQPASFPQGEPKPDMRKALRIR
jgi:hypothetical protein